MKLQSKVVSLFAFALVGAVIVGDASVAGADPANAGPQSDPTQDPHNAPGPPLGSALKFQLANKALGAAGLPPLKVTPPPAQFKLTVAAQTNNGAFIAFMGPGAWIGGGAYIPEGSFQLIPAPASYNPNVINPSRVDMRFPAEIGKLYLIDCKITNLPAAGQQVQFWGLPTAPGTFTGPKSQVAEEAGHVLYSLQAKVALEGVTLATYNTNHFSFHGCEITKVN